MPAIRKVRAPTMSMSPLLAAVIFILTGIKCCFPSPSFFRRFVPARHDWHPVSAMAGQGMVRVGFEIVEVKPRLRMSTGTARIETSMNGWGSDARFSHALQNSF
jgi:hypothetical protein